MRPRLHSITSLRFFAALHVVLFHMRVIGILSGGPWWYQNFASIGYVGVNFFFVLSGFILVYTYEGPELNARNFWWARFARIYPAYLLSLIVAAPFFLFALRHLDLPFYAWTKQHTFWACTLTLSLLQAWAPEAALTWNSVCWSLSVEAFFYFSCYAPENLPQPVWLWACSRCGWSVFLSLSAMYFSIRTESTRSIPLKPLSSGRTF